MTASHGCHRQSCSLSALTLSNARRSRPSSSLHVMRARSHGHGEMVTVHIKRYACHAAPCCKQLDRRTLSGPCFSMLAISAHLTFSCVVCPALWPPVCAVQTQHRVLPMHEGHVFQGAAQGTSTSGSASRRSSCTPPSRARERRVLRGVGRAERMTKL